MLQLKGRPERRRLVLVMQNLLPNPLAASDSSRSTGGASRIIQRARVRAVGTAGRSRSALGSGNRFNIFGTGLELD